MSENLERTKSRLDNIQAIEPLLSALRTISMGAWQSALNKIAQTNAYLAGLDLVLQAVIPEIKKQNTFTKNKSSKIEKIFLTIGSERGLVGKFNNSLLENVLTWIDANHPETYQIWAMGTRMIQALEKRNIQIAWQNKLPASSNVNYLDAYNLTQDWLNQYESYSFDSIIIFYNHLYKGTKVGFATRTLLPYQIRTNFDLDQKIESSWPPPIIETSPRDIYNQVIQQYLASSFYQVLLESSAAEHATRYNLMEDAKDNAEGIIKELMLTVNAERKKQITKEMQELASGSGLIRS